jgi:hypothetical protein
MFIRALNWKMDGQKGATDIICDVVFDSHDTMFLTNYLITKMYCVKY